MRRGSFCHGAALPGSFRAMILAGSTSDNVSPCYPSPRARGEGWGPIVRLIGLQDPLPRKDFNPLQIPTPPLRARPGRASGGPRNGDEVRFGVRVSTPWISAGAEWPWVRWLAFAASVVAVRPE